MSIIENMMNEIGSSVSFYIGRKKLIFGGVENPDDFLESISLVLSQAIDALKDVAIREIVIDGDEKYILLILKGREIFGFLLPKSKDKEDVLRVFHSKEEEILEEIFPKKKPEVKEVKIEETRKVEEKVEEKVEAKKEVEEKLYSGDILNVILDVAKETLGDFATEIFENIVQDLNIEKENIKKDKIMELVNELEKSAKMIVGPTKSANMRDDILQKIKEVE
uniref:Uncharacterized protein n=1 Tax=candidate division WOR-3 bacterium TaxID=2052148 RepID=A0A7C4UD59_UNCW3